MVGFLLRRLHARMRTVLRQSIRAGRVPPHDTWLTGRRDDPSGSCPRCGTTLSHGRVKVSFRSVGDVDVADLAHQFGGGGHKKASGASLEGSLGEVQERVLGVAREYLAAR